METAPSDVESGPPARSGAVLPPLAWALVCLVAMFAVEILTTGVLMARAEARPWEEVFSAEVDAGLLLGVAVWARLPVLVLLVAIPALIARRSIAEDLGWRLPGLRPFLWAFVGLVVCFVTLESLAWALDRPIPEFMRACYERPGNVALLLGALVIAAPLQEELLFRGYLFRALEASPLGTVGAIGLPALAFGLAHMQYEPFEMAGVIAVGVYLGWVRHRTGSTIAAVVLHGVYNLAATLLVAAELHEPVV